MRQPKAIAHLAGALGDQLSAARLRNTAEEEKNSQLR